MKRRASALSVSAAALLAAAAPLLTGCSTDSHPGAAAVVGEEEITISSLQSEVEAVRDAQRAEPDGDALIAASGELSRQRLKFLVDLHVLEQAAEEAGVSVSRRDVQAYRAQIEGSAGGAEALREAALKPQQNSMPLAGDEQIDQVLRQDLLLQGLAARLGLSNDQQGFERYNELLRETAEDIGVDVNPRYGEWDPREAQLLEADMPWLRAETGDEPAQPVTLGG